MARDLAQEALWVEGLLDRAGVPTESYEAQGGGMCRWTLAGRVDHLLRLLERHDVPLDEGVLLPVAPPRQRLASETQPNKETTS